MNTEQERADFEAWPAGAWLDCHDIDLTALFTRLPENLKQGEAHA